MSLGGLEVSLRKKERKWCQVLTSNKYNFELPSNIIPIAYCPYGLISRVCYWRRINISRLQRSSKDDGGEKTKKRKGQGRESRELHDDNEVSQNIKRSMSLRTSRHEAPSRGLYSTPPDPDVLSYDLTNVQIGEIRLRILCPEQLTDHGAILRSHSSVIFFLDTGTLGYF